MKNNEVRQMKTASRWHTFTMDHYERSHKSYADASFWAQCSHDTSYRPTRIAAGFYLLHSTYIATAEAARANGFEFPELSETGEKINT